MALGSDGMTITTGANFIPEIWSKEVQMTVKSNLVLANLVKRFDSEVADAGDILHVPKVSNIAANAKAANTQVTLNAPTEGEFTLSINKHYESSYLVEDRLKAQAKHDILKQYAPQAGYAIAKQIDTDIASLYAGFSQNVGNGSTNITDANLIIAIQYLDDADAPADDRYFVIKPAGLADLRGVDKFMRFDSLGISPVTGDGLAKGDSAVVRRRAPNGFIGVVYGVEVYMSTNLVVEDSSPDVNHYLLFQKEALALGVQRKARMQFQYKQEYLGTLATTDALYGVGEYRDAFGVDFRAQI